MNFSCSSKLKLAWCSVCLPPHRRYPLLEALCFLIVRLSVCMFKSCSNVHLDSRRTWLWPVTSQSPFLSHNSRIHLWHTFRTNVSRVKMMKWWHFYIKRHLWHHSVSSTREQKSTWWPDLTSHTWASALKLRRAAVLKQPRVRTCSIVAATPTFEALCSVTPHWFCWYWASADRFCTMWRSSLSITTYTLWAWTGGNGILSGEQSQTAASQLLHWHASDNARLFDLFIHFVRTSKQCCSARVVVDSGMVQYLLFLCWVFTYSQLLYFQHDMRATCLTADWEEAKYHTRTHPEQKATFHRIRQTLTTGSAFCRIDFFAVRQDVHSTHPLTGCHDCYHLNLAFTSWCCRLYPKGG